MAAVGFLATNVPRAPSAHRLRQHLLIGSVALSFYGVQVCPFVASLGPIENALPIVLSFFAIALLRPVLYAVCATSEALDPERVFVLDFSLYLGAAVGVASFFGVNYGFPVGSGLKVLLGYLLMGAFAALDTALSQSRQSTSTIRDGALVPIGRRVLLFTSFVTLGFAAVTLLIVIKDMDWLLDPLREIGDVQARLVIVLEFLVVLGLMLGLAANIVLRYNDIFSHRLRQHSAVLANVAKGALSERMAETGCDELSLLALRTNATIEALERGQRELMDTRDLTIVALSALAETRDNETGAHIVRTQHYVRVLAEHMSTQPEFAEQLAPAYVELLFKSAPLHDVGKIGIPDHILLKPGKLTEGEFAIMKQHAVLGRDALRSASRGNEASAFLALAEEIAYHHHEKWDGSGYPQGLAGEAIPLSARLMALADVYDALISKRVYKEAMTHEQAKVLILDGRGTHFDPRVVDAFSACEPAFRDIARRHAY